MSAESDAYEELTKDLVACLSQDDGTTTVRLERDVRNVPGKATGHQVDVLWQFTSDLPPEVQTVLFECRLHSKRIEKNALLAFKGVVDDIAGYTGSDRLQNPHGVMVTYTGYQRGARSVADTYGVEILELRDPTDADFAGRVSRFHITMVARQPVIENFGIEPADPAEIDPDRTLVGALEHFELEHADGTRETLLDVLTRGVLAGLDEPPRPKQRVVRRFETPMRLLLAGEEAASIVAVAADVSEAVIEDDFTLDGRKRVARVLRDALTDARVWFADDGKVWSTG